MSSRICSDDIFPQFYAFMPPGLRQRQKPGIGKGAGLHPYPFGTSESTTLIEVIKTY